MCGRYVTPGEADIERHWHIGRHNWRSPFATVRQMRYNVAPRQGNPQDYVPVIRVAADKTLELTDMQWWLLPFWSKEPRVKYSTFNARMETAATAASFRDPFRYRRCLIPALGWYEWQQTPAGKLPWYFHSADNALLAFAGLWDRWEHAGQVIESCTILVGEADVTMRQIHDRMPVLIPAESQEEWLSREVTERQRVMELLESRPTMALAFHRVDSSSAAGSLGAQTGAYGFRPSGR